MVFGFAAAFLACFKRLTAVQVIPNFLAKFRAIVQQNAVAGKIFAIVRREMRRPGAEVQAPILEHMTTMANPAMLKCSAQCFSVVQFMIKRHFLETLLVFPVYRDAVCFGALANVAPMSFR